MNMKLTIFSTSRILGGFWICPFAAALAIEPPPDNARPPAPLAGKPEQTAPATPAARPQQNLPFLGLATAALPEMVADHLPIEPGTGVIVRTVCPDSPAEKAGLSVNDIILHVDDIAVGDPEALSSTIRSRKAGDRLRVDLIHRGKPAKVEVTLEERPADFISQMQQDPMLEGLPKAHADRLRGLIEQNLQAFGNNHPGAFPDGRFENTFRQMRQQMNRALEDDTPPGPDENGGIRFQQNSTIRLMDNEGSVEINSTNGATDVTVRDDSNEIVWSGPWQTADDKAAAPEDIRKRIERVHSGNGKGFNFRFGKLGAPEIIDN
jgi:serine protease Do